MLPRHNVKHNAHHNVKHNAKLVTSDIQNKRSITMLLIRGLEAR